MIPEKIRGRNVAATAAPTMRFHPSQVPQRRAAGPPGRGSARAIQYASTSKTTCGRIDAPAARARAEASRPHRPGHPWRISRPTMASRAPSPSRWAAWL